MMFTHDVVFGKVTACNGENTLTVELENGETGIVPVAEISRRPLTPQTNFGWMVGRRYGFFPSDEFTDGFRILSGKAYEEASYQSIRDAFLRKERNVYLAHLKSVHPAGKLAFYTLAQGVNAAISVMDFCLMRIASFHDLDMPKDIVVAIKRIDPENGNIHLCGKIAFGDYYSGVDRLAISVGDVVEGYVANALPSNNDSVVALTPNLSVLCEPTPPGTWVKVRINRAFHEEQRLKAEIVERLDDEKKRFPFSSFCVGLDSYPAWVDIEAFERRIGPRKRLPLPAPAAAATPPAAPPEPSYDLTTADFSFAVREDETAVRSPLNGGSPGKILFEATHQYLTDRHLMVANAINELRYSNIWLLRRYLHMKHSLVLSDNAINTVVNRLVRLDIVSTLRFRVGEEDSNQLIFIPGPTLYTNYTGCSRSLRNFAYTATPDPMIIKGHMGVNLLLLGLMRDGNVESVIRPDCMLSQTGSRVRGCIKVTTKDHRSIYLESSRGSSHQYMLNKLSKYQICLPEAGESDACVAVTLEDEGEIAAFVKEAADLHLSFDVMVTCDSKCLPLPVFTIVPAYKPEDRSNSIFGRIKRFFGM